MVYNTIREMLADRIWAVSVDCGHKRDHRAVASIRRRYDGCGGFYYDVHVAQSEMQKRPELKLAALAMDGFPTKEAAAQWVVDHFEGITL